MKKEKWYPKNSLPRLCRAENDEVPAKDEASLLYLFFTFLKLGAYSFGGFMALVAVVRSELVEKAKILTEDKLMEGISLASLLPGPVAVNVIAFTGHHLRGIGGAAVCMVGILLPSFLLIFLLSILYFKFNYLPFVSPLFSGILPAVAAIVLGAAIDMSEKSILNWKQAALAMIALVVSLGSKSYLAAVFILLGSALIGCLITKNFRNQVETKKKNKRSMTPILAAAFVAALAAAAFIALPLPNASPALLIQRQITLTFSGMSLTAVGGGYVVIPAMQKLFVESLHWLSGREFSDALAMGQITPGPIFISAAFIGYKAGGAWGALNATLSVFVPPALLTLVGARFLSFISDSVYVKAAFNGIRPAVIGMILSAAVFLLTQADLDWRGWFIFAFAFIIIKFLKTEPVIIIIMSAGINLLLREI